MKSTQLSVSPFVLGDLWEVITGCWASVLTLIYTLKVLSGLNWESTTLWNACIIKVRDLLALWYVRDLLVAAGWSSCQWSCHTHSVLLNPYTHAVGEFYLSAVPRNCCFLLCVCVKICCCSKVKLVIPTHTYIRTYVCMYVCSYTADCCSSSGSCNS